MCGICSSFIDHLAQYIFSFHYISCSLILWDTSRSELIPKSYQVIIWPDAKQFSEVAEGHRSVCFEAKVREMVGRSEVAAFTSVQNEKQNKNKMTTFFSNETAAGSWRCVHSTDLGKKILSTT